MEKDLAKLKRLLTASICIMLVFAVVVLSAGAYSIIDSKKFMHKLENGLSLTVDTGEEDGIIIMNEYKIESTTQISDAYLSNDTSKLSDRDKETLDNAKKVIDEIIKDDMTPYEKEKAVYDWITQNIGEDEGVLTVIPATQEDVDNPYGVLKNHNAVCVGYATTFRLFMQMLGMECKVIHSSDLVHSWDLVKLDDEWYHVDCYMDADSRGGYANFNMDDAAAENSHDWNKQYFPAATGSKYNFAMTNLTQVKNVYAIPKQLKKMIEKDETMRCFSFKEKITSENEAEAAALVNVLLAGLNESKYSDDYYFTSRWNKNSDGDYVLGLFIEKYNSNGNSKLDEKTIQKIEDSISKQFDKSYFSEYLRELSGERNIDDFDYDDESEFTWTETMDETVVATTERVG